VFHLAPIPRRRAGGREAARGGFLKTAADRIWRRSANKRDKSRSRSQLQRARKIKRRSEDIGYYRDLLIAGE
jgi:hypothetical protein